MDLGWYCPSEGDGRWLGTRRAGARARTPSTSPASRGPPSARAPPRSWCPPATVNDSFAPEAPFMESWTAATAVAALTRSIRVIVAINPAGLAPELAAHQLETLERVAPGRVARQPGRRRRARGAATAPRSSTTPPATRGCARSPTWCAAASPGPSTWAAPARRPRTLAADVAEHLPDVGRAARADRRARSPPCARGRAARCAWACASTSSPAPTSARPARPRASCCRAPRSRATGRPSTRASTASARPA